MHAPEANLVGQADPSTLARTRRTIEGRDALRDHRITIEGEGYWSFRVFVSESPAPELTLSPLNSVLPDIPKEFAKIDLERLHDFFEDLILDNGAEQSILLVARIEKRREVLSCFPHSEGSLEAWHYYRALSAMPRIKGTSLFYHFGHDLGPWYLGFSRKIPRRSLGRIGSTWRSFCSQKVNYLQKSPLHAAKGTSEQPLVNDV
jgi:hypothetical protein